MAQWFFWSQVHALIILVVNTFAQYLTTQNTGWHRGFSGLKYVPLLHWLLIHLHYIWQHKIDGTEVFLVSSTCPYYAGCKYIYTISDNTKYWMAQSFFWSQIHVLFIIVVKTCTTSTSQTCTSHNTNYWVKQMGVISGPKCMPLIAFFYGPKYMYLLYRLLIHIVWYLTIDSSWWHKQRFFWSQVYVLIIPLINTYCTVSVSDDQQFLMAQTEIFLVPSTCPFYTSYKYLLHLSDNQQFLMAQTEIFLTPSTCPCYTVVNTCKPYLTTQSTRWHKQVWVVSFFVCVQNMLMSSFLTLML